MYLSLWRGLQLQMEKLDKKEPLNQFLVEKLHVKSNTLIYKKKFITGLCVHTTYEHETCSLIIVFIPWL